MTVTLALLVGSAADVYTAAAHIVAAVIGVTLAIVDASVQRLPDRLTSAALLGVAVPLSAGFAVDGAWDDAQRAVCAAAATAACYLALTLLAAGGFGDVKLAPTIGLLLGSISWQAVFTGGLLAFLGTAAVASALWLSGRLKPGDHIALGPGMLIGAAVTIVGSSG